MQVEAEEEDYYVVVTTTYPTSYGCHRGKTWSRAEMIARSDVDISNKQFKTYEEAVEHARHIRNDSEWFEGEESDDDDNDDDDEDLPPWDSADLQNYDNDEEILIRVMKHSEYEEEVAEDQEFLQEARANAHFDSIWNCELTRLRVMNSECRVHYSRRPQEYDIPAELEIDESKEDAFVMPSNAGKIKTLMYKGTDEKMGKVTKDYAEDEDSDFDLLELLRGCTSLEELYLRSTGFQTLLGEDFVRAMLTKAPHLRRTLKVFSVAGLMVEPSAMALLGQLEKLIRLDLSDCFSTEFWQEPGFDEFDMECESLPYDDPLMTCLDDLTHLRRLDLGNGDWESRRYLHDYSLSRSALEVVEECMEDCGGRVSFDNDNTPVPFSDRAREEAAKLQALLCIQENKENKYSAETVQLAQKKLKTCPVCHKENSSKRCSACKRQWYCDQKCQKSDFKKHKKQCCQKFKF